MATKLEREILLRVESKVDGVAVEQARMGAEFVGMKANLALHVRRCDALEEALDLYKKDVEARIRPVTSARAALSVLLYLAGVIAAAAVAYEKVVTIILPAVRSLAP